MITHDFEDGEILEYGYATEKRRTKDTVENAKGETIQSAKASFPTREEKTITYIYLTLTYMAKDSNDRVRYCASGASLRVA